MSCRFPRNGAQYSTGSTYSCSVTQCVTQFPVASREVPSGDLQKAASIPWFGGWLVWAEASWMVRREAEEEQPDLSANSEVWAVARARVGE